MKCSFNWLCEKTGFDQPLEILIQALVTRAGIEVASVQPVANRLENVVVGCVQRVEKHPDAERLHVCTVKVGDNEPLTIVCGASNVKADMKVPVALIDGQVGDMKIKKAKLRGVASSGMICSSSELGITETSQGIMQLPNNAPIGEDIKTYLQLHDHILDLEITPNRGDCLSMEGLAREVCVLFDLDYVPTRVQISTESSPDIPIPSVNIDAPEACPRYVGRVIENINMAIETPWWLKERLRRSGMRSIDPVVDVMNYVMLELGQPLHAFDFKKISGEIHVRYAKPGESITLLDDRHCVLDTDTLIIADQKAPLAIAGIMGGKDSAVSKQTRNIFIESAYFAPQVITNKARKYALHTDASHRFERGVDYQLQRRAIEYATELLLSIVNGVPSNIIEKISDMLPHPQHVTLRYSQIRELLGVEVAKEQVQRWFKRLGFKQVKATETTCEVTIPSHRFDITLEQDLIEEVGRLYGLDKIPSQPLVAALRVNAFDQTKITMDQCRQLFIEREYHEAVTYSFVSPDLQALLKRADQQIALRNPMSSDMAVMRTSLLPGLLTAVQYNQARQQSRLRLFEIAACFHQGGKSMQQITCLAGVCSGAWHDPQWGSETRPLDFFDVKADLEALLSLGGEPDHYRWQAIEDLMMHPGQCVAIYRDNKKVGVLGALHPVIVRKMDIVPPIFVFELYFNELVTAKQSEFAKLSKYPSVKRDIAFLVEKSISAGALEAHIRRQANNWLISLQLFDVYENVASAKDRKSMAFSLTLQHPDRTLQDGEVDALITSLVDSLKQEYSIQLRE
jgi:phenylalanyl-tRNA synthetase beta chain